MLHTIYEIAWHTLFFIGVPLACAIGFMAGMGDFDD